MATKHDGNQLLKWTAWSINALWLSALLLTTGPAFARTDLTAAAANTTDRAKDGIDDISIQRELNVFKKVAILLVDALASAQKLHRNATVVDASFDGSPPSPVFRVKSFSGAWVWEDVIDASSGKPVGAAIPTAVKDLDERDRRILASLTFVKQDVLDAVRVAERNITGKAISAGLVEEKSKLNFIVVVVSGNDLKQVFLEPPVRRPSKR
ncbi:PepSY domain-containing protein [Bradyrhizobium sp. 33ap4]|uniref:PepSY domain-containing protein n=1 Tax=Bradyrhizobium sp. 33ap4 TaxID=3061630 RepID=UPI00292D59A8|nr:PepSY domain-containing protein [Bradyrhizobium sp. 33ap4]